MIKISPKKIIIGTVKFGIPNYGLNNNNSNKDFSDFLLQSFHLGVNQLDTAERYGQSEKIIGSFIKKNQIEYNVSTKIDNLKHNDSQSFRIVKKSILSSLKKLNTEKIHICYLHQNDISIILDNYIQEALLELKEKKLIQYIGASIYTVDECNAAIESKVYDFIQIPINIIDTSIYDSCVLNYQGNVKFIARSIYLQGLLTNPNQQHKINNFNKEIFDYLNEIKIIGDEVGISLSDLSRSFVYNLNNIESYIIGTTSLNNLKNNFFKYDFTKDLNLFNKIYSKSRIKKSWSNPRNWVIN